LLSGLFQRTSRSESGGGGGGFAQRTNAVAPGARDRAGGQRRLRPDGGFDQLRRGIAMTVRDRRDFWHPVLVRFDPADDSPLVDYSKQSREVYESPLESRGRGSKMFARIVTG